MTILATYDIREDQRRARLAAVLQAYGDRIQKSVFLLQLDQDELDKVTDLADQIMDYDTDSLWLLRQCATCFESLIAMGQTTPTKPTLYWAAF